MTTAPQKVFKLGRNRPRARGPRLSLGNYLLASLPPPPPAVDYALKGRDWLSRILGNDALGDCTAAAAFHAGGLFLANAGITPVPYTLDEVIAFYSATSGYVPGDPSTDNGANEVDVLNYWRVNGLTPSAHQITGYMGVNPGSKTEQMQAMWLFENLYFGIELPDAWVNPMPSGDGFVWDVAGESNPNYGHAFIGVGYDDKGVKVDSWGYIGTISWAAIDKYCRPSPGGELWVVLGPDSINKASGKAPNGFDISQLLADMQAIS